MKLPKFFDFLEDEKKYILIGKNPIVLNQKKIKILILL